MSMLGVVFGLISFQLATVLGSEPVCSQFHYEERTLEKMIRQEFAVEKMKTEMENMKRKVEKSLSELENEKQKVSEEIGKNKETIEEMKRTVENSVANINARNDESIKSFSSEIERIKASAGSSVVAFKARKGTDLSLSDNKVIIFAENLLNLANGYNNKTGIFTAPVDGLYSFTAQICLHNEDWTYFGIFAGDKRVSNILIGENDWHHCGSFDAVTVLNQGEVASVQCVGSCSTDKLWEPDLAWNSFSGVLLYTYTI